MEVHDAGGALSHARDDPVRPEIGREERGVAAPIWLEHCAVDATSRTAKPTAGTTVISQHAWIRGLPLIDDHPGVHAELYERLVQRVRTPRCSAADVAEGQVHDSHVAPVSTMACASRSLPTTIAW